MSGQKNANLVYQSLSLAVPKAITTLADFPSTVKMHRELGATQEGLQRIVGTDRTSIFRYEHGYQHPRDPVVLLVFLYSAEHLRQRLQSLS